MSRFGHLKVYDPRGRRVWYTLPIEGDPRPRLELVHAGSTNKPYTQATLSANAKTGNTRRMQRGQHSASMIEDGLRIDRELFPKHVIKGWSGVKDVEGNEVPFSVQACTEFLEALPDWIMQDISAFAGVGANFVDDSAPTEEEIEEHAGE